MPVLIERFEKSFEAKVKNTIKKYKLLKKKDKVIVACSGGKDSTTTAYLLKKFGYNVEALFIDLDIENSSMENLSNLRLFCTNNAIKLHTVRLKDEFGASLDGIYKRLKGKMTHCALCGILKRYLLNKKARELGAAKLATGHNLDDEAENVLLNIFGGNLQISLGLGPVSGLTRDAKFVQKIKPLYLCRNEETRKYTLIKGFKIIYCACPFSTDAFRREVRKLLKGAEEEDKDIKIKLVSNFARILPKLRKAYAQKSSVNYCTLCGEPSRNKVCKKCELLSV